MENTGIFCDPKGRNGVDYAAACRALTGPGRSYHIETYGCQMNVRDSETLTGLLVACGFSHAGSRESADLVLFNTCCVREHAEKRVFGNIGALREWKEEIPGRILAVCGCMMQQQQVAQKLFRRFLYVDLVFGTHMQKKLPELLFTALSGERVLAVSDDAAGIFEGLPAVRGGGVSSFVNINYGCNNYCTYCIVPYVRGPERSRAIPDIVKETELIVRGGGTEVTLLGQNVNSYGSDLAGVDFTDVLTVVNRIEGLFRIRFMTSHPKDLSDRLINAMANLDKVCHHVHLPLQSGSDRVLMAMNRKYSRAHYLDVVHKLRAAMPDVELTTDVIVGFPGETEAEFCDTLSLVDEVGFATAFTFKYSPRTGTAAADMPEQVDEAVKRERLGRLNALQAQKTLENNLKYVGHSGEALVEGYDHKSGAAYGKYRNFKMVYFPGDADLIGRYVTVRAERVRGNSLAGKMERNGET